VVLRRRREHRAQIQQQRVKFGAIQNARFDKQRAGPVRRQRRIVLDPLLELLRRAARRRDWEIRSHH
jgi:hypothetical protein